MLLTTLDILYIVLSLFTSIIGVLLVIVLLRLISILGVVKEVTDYYYTIKKYIAMYEKIPAMIKEKVSELIGKDVEK